MSWIEDHPELTAQWCTVNRELDEFTRGSNFIGTWKCERDHVWEAPIKSRTVMGSGCPYCSGRRPIVGETDLATMRPDVAVLVSPDNPLQAHELTAMSHKKVLWRCPQGHEWSRAVAQQVKSGARCAECPRPSASTENSVALLNPEIAVDWSATNTLRADQHAVNRGEVEWDCHTCRTVWRARVSERAMGRNPCPSCSGKELDEGVNDLATLRPGLARWWRSTDRSPSSVTLRTDTYVQWECTHGHEYTMTVLRRVSRRDDYCPMCAVCRMDKHGPLSASHPNVTSWWSESNPFTAEQVASTSSRVIAWRCPQGHTFDKKVSTMVRNTACPECTAARRRVAVPDNRLPTARRLAVTHPDFATWWSAENDFPLDEVHARSSYRAIWNPPCGHTARVPVKRFVERNGACPVCSGRQVQIGVNDLATISPVVAAEWCPSNSRPPTAYSAGSSVIAAWVGATCGHEWRARIADRVGKGSGCPVCSGNKVLAGFNDLATTNPAKASEWHPDNALSPSEVMAGHNGQVHWLCAQGHDWYASPLMRTYADTSCPVCSGLRVDPGVTDLFTRHPLVAAEWHPSKNTDSPTQVKSGSHRKVWWQGKCGHEWQATILNRTNGSGCPQCSNNVSKAETELREFVQSLIPSETVIASDRRALGGRSELDIYIPGRALAIEFNGVFWHSSAAGKSKTYHRDKRNAAAANGIRLIQVWEDDWAARRDVVKNMIRARLGVGVGTKINARECTVVALDYSNAAVFLEANHLQGKVRGTHYDGLIFAGELVAVMVCTATSTGMRMDRFATVGSVRGGFTKLLTVTERRLAESGGGDIVTFADCDHSSGEVYLRSGFTLTGELPPDYSYLHKNVRRHKFGFRKGRFRTDPDLKYADGLTESQLAELNGIPRVYDSGKLRFRKVV